MTVYYEWDVEEVANEDLTADGQNFAENDVMEHYFQTSFKDCVSFANSGTHSEHNTRLDIVLVRDDDDRRAWAYLQEDGTMPEYFCDADGREYKKVPKRFHDEVKKIQNSC